jgi:riboflavin synthase alpha subunit
VDGHFVQGHIDGTARIRQVGSGSAGQLWTFEASSDLMPYIIPKGSIAIEGISLTIASVQENTFGIALIPTTIERTTLARMNTGDRVNIETDILVRTIVATLRRQPASGEQPGHSGAGLTVEQLLENGW